MLNPVAFGAALDGVADDTAAWQAALNAAAIGETVDAGPAFRSRIVGGLNVPMGVRLGVEGRGPFDPRTNPALNTWGPTFIVEQSTTVPAVMLNWQTALGDFIFYSANQAPPNAPSAIPFAPFVETAPFVGGCRIGAPYFANAWIGIHIRGGRHIIDSPQIGALARGVVIDDAEDVVSINRILCHPYWRLAEGQPYNATQGSLDSFALSQSFGLEVKRADGFRVGDLFTYALYGGAYFSDSPNTALSPRAAFGFVGRLNADRCAYGVLARSTGDQGILVGQGMFSANPPGCGAPGQVAVGTLTGGLSNPELTVRSWSHRGSWAGGASSKGSASHVLVVPATNPG